MGYDISNYEEVYAPYGTVEDMQVLIEGSHKRCLAPSPSGGPVPATV